MISFYFKLRELILASNDGGTNQRALYTKVYPESPEFSSSFLIFEAAKNWDENLGMTKTQGIPGKGGAQMTLPPPINYLFGNTLKYIFFYSFPQISLKFIQTRKYLY